MFNWLGGAGAPVVKFSDEYKLVDSLLELGQPSLVEAEELVVEGLVRFAEGVVIVGKVQFVNRGDVVKVVEAGRYEGVSVEL